MRKMNSTSKQVSAALCLLAVAVGGCASSKAPRSGQLPPPTASGSYRTAAAEPYPPSAGYGAQAGYALQAGDELDLAFFKTPELNTTTTIRPDGKIALQLVGDVPAAGLQPGELADALARRYASELRSPRINVNVRRFGGQRVYIGGEVAKPGMVQLDNLTTVLQAIYQAGGFKDSAQPAGVVLIRRGAGGVAVGTELDLSSVRTHPEADRMLQPFDIVYVPKSRIAKLDVFVDQYIRQLWPLQPSIGIGVGNF